MEMITDIRELEKYYRPMDRVAVELIHVERKYMDEVLPDRGPQPPYPEMPLFDIFGLAKDQRVYDAWHKQREADKQAFVDYGELGRRRQKVREEFTPPELVKISPEIASSLFLALQENRRIQNEVLRDDVKSVLGTLNTVGHLAWAALLPTPHSIASGGAAVAKKIIAERQYTERLTAITENFDRFVEGVLGKSDGIYRLMERDGEYYLHREEQKTTYLPEPRGRPTKHVSCPRAGIDDSVNVPRLLEIAKASIDKSKNGVDGPG